MRCTTSTATGRTPRVLAARVDTLAARLVAIARARSARGERVSYVSHVLPSTDFLDDGHLKPDGNRRMAAAFAAALAPLLGS